MRTSRCASFAAASFAVVLATALAHGDDGAVQRFGDPGQLVVAMPRLVPVGGFTSRAVGTSTAIDATRGGALTLFSDPDGTGAYAVPRVALDVAVAPRVLVGADVAAYTTFGPVPAIGDGTATTLWAVAPHAGYVVAMDRTVSAWLRAGAAYYGETDRGASGTSGAPETYSVTWKQLDADVEAHLVIAPSPHVAITAGLVAELPLYGRFDEEHGGVTVAASSAWWHAGVAGGVAGWL